MTRYARRTVSILALAAALAGCESSAASTSTAASRKLPNGPAIVVPAYEGQDIVGYDILLSSAANSCALRQANAYVKGETLVSLGLRARTDQGGIAALAPGVFAVGVGPGTAKSYAVAMHAQLKSDSCATTQDEAGRTATGGSVTLVAYGVKGAAKGTFTLNFADGEKLSGSFDASYCDMAKAASASSCQ